MVMKRENSHVFGLPLNMKIDTGECFLPRVM